MSGYARIHRQVLDHPAFRNEAEALAFVGLVLRASWRPVRVRYKGRPVTLNRGQLAVSVRDFAEALDRDKGWVERLFKRLKSETMIETHAETGVLVVTICNYDKYQVCNDERETVRETADETDARQTQDTEQRREEGNKEEELSPSGDCASADALKPEHVVDAWNDLAERIGKPKVRDITPTRRTALRARIAGYSLDDWRTVLDSIERSPFLRGDKGWSGCNFDWLLKKVNFQKILEGNYDDKPTPSYVRH